MVGACGTICQLRLSITTSFTSIRIGRKKMEIVIQQFTAKKRPAMSEEHAYFDAYI